MTSLAQSDTVSGSQTQVTRGTLTVAAVFFVSGIPALIYQLVWQRALFTMFGINIEAVTVVIAGFLMGLGIGSFLGGRISRRPSLNLLVAFGAIELVIAACGAMSLRIIAFVGSYTLDLPPIPLTTVTIALLFVPTLFMGSTLPILSVYLCPPLAQCWSVGWIPLLRQHHRVRNRLPLVRPLSRTDSYGTQAQ